MDTNRNMVKVTNERSFRERERRKVKTKKTEKTLFAVCLSSLSLTERTLVGDLDHVPVGVHLVAVEPLINNLAPVELDKGLS